jgi:hypothetical protein
MAMTTWACPVPTLILALGAKGHQRGASWPETQHALGDALRNSEPLWRLASAGPPIAIRISVRLSCRVTGDSLGGTGVD